MSIWFFSPYTRKWGWLSKYVELKTPYGLRDCASVWIYVNRYYEWPWLLWREQ